MGHIEDTGIEVSQLRERIAKLQAFKDWVHAYLDAHGVPHHPPGTHGAAGCRIGDRMDWLMASLDAKDEVIQRMREIWSAQVDLLTKREDTKRGKESFED